MTEDEYIIVTENEPKRQVSWHEFREMVMREFTDWAKECGHYPAVPLAENFLKRKENDPE